MEKEHWFLKMSSWDWSPLAFGGAICIAEWAVSGIMSVQGAIGGVGMVWFLWLAAVKAFYKKPIKK